MISVSGMGCTVWDSGCGVWGLRLEIPSLTIIARSTLLHCNIGEMQMRILERALHIRISEGAEAGKPTGPEMDGYESR